MKKLNVKQMKQINGGSGSAATLNFACACVRRCDRIAQVCQISGGTNCDNQHAACLAACPAGC